MTGVSTVAAFAGGNGAAEEVDVELVIYCNFNLPNSPAAGPPSFSDEEWTGEGCRAP